MLQMDLPHVNVLSKIDNLSQYDALPFNLDYYTEVQDLSYLLPFLEKELSSFRGEKWRGLNEAVTKLIEDFGLVHFEVLAVENKKSVMHLLRVIDRAGGYVFGGAEGANDTVWQVAMRNEASMLDVQDIQERWVDNKEAHDELERREWEEQATEMAEKAAQPTQGGPADEEMDDLPVPGPDSGVKVVRKSR